jgi:hypothetical protein
MSSPAPANLTLTDPGDAPATTGHVRQRRTGAKRSLTTVEFTMAEREVLDRLAAATGGSRAAVLRDALRAYAEEQGEKIDQEARPAA